MSKEYDPFRGLRIFMPFFDLKDKIVRWLEEKRYNRYKRKMKKEGGNK